MAPDETLGTRDRIYAAAVVEFSTHGLAGATIDRIARRANANRERVYSYFSDKRSLFFHVTSAELGKLADAVPLQIQGPEDIGAFAGAAFDYQYEHPSVARLVLWEGLVDDEGLATDLLERAPLYAKKTEAVADAQRQGCIDDRIEPAAFIFLIISLASYWLAAPQLAHLLMPETADGETRTRRRTAVIEAAVRLATPLQS